MCVAIYYSLFLFLSALLSRLWPTLLTSLPKPSMVLHPAMTAMANIVNMAAMIFKYMTASSFEKNMPLTLASRVSLISRTTLECSVGRGLQMRQTALNRLDRGRRSTLKGRVLDPFLPPVVLQKNGTFADFAVRPVRTFGAPNLKSLQSRRSLNLLNQKRQTVVTGSRCQR